MVRAHGKKNILVRNYVQMVLPTVPRRTLRSFVGAEEILRESHRDFVMLFLKLFIIIIIFN